MEERRKERTMLGEVIRRIRKEKGLTQGELAKLSGLRRSTIVLYETTGVKKPNAEALLKISYGLKVDPATLFAAAGLGYYVSSQRPMKRLKDIVDELYMQLPAEVPIYDDFIAVCRDLGQRMSIEPMSMLYRNKEDVVRPLEGYVVSNTDMEPLIVDGDIVVIDRSLEPVEGNIVYCVHVDQSRAFLGRMVVENGALRIANNRLLVGREDCYACYVVVTMRRNFVGY